MKKLEVVIEEMGDYIGVDIDNRNFYRLLKRYFTAAQFGMVTVEYKEKSYHLKIWGNFTEEESLYIRRIIGDDHERVASDEQKMKFPKRISDWLFNTLFDGKTVQKHLIKYVIIDPLAPPFNDPIDTEKRRSVR